MLVLPEPVMPWRRRVGVLRPLRSLRAVCCAAFKGILVADFSSVRAGANCEAKPWPPKSFGRRALVRLEGRKRLATVGRGVR